MSPAQDPTRVSPLFLNTHTSSPSKYVRNPKFETTFSLMVSHLHSPILSLLPSWSSSSLSLGKPLKPPHPSINPRTLHIRHGEKSAASVAPVVTITTTTHQQLRPNPVSYKIQALEAFASSLRLRHRIPYSFACYTSIAFNSSLYPNFLRAFRGSCEW